MRENLEWSTTLHKCWWWCVYALRHKKKIIILRPTTHNTHKHSTHRIQLNSFNISAHKVINQQACVFTKNLLWQKCECSLSLHTTNSHNRSHIGTYDHVHVCPQTLDFLCSLLWLIGDLNNKQTNSVSQSVNHSLKLMMWFDIDHQITHLRIYHLIN